MCNLTWNEVLSTAVASFDPPENPVYGVTVWDDGVQYLVYMPDYEVKRMGTNPQYWDWVSARKVAKKVA